MGLVVLVIERIREDPQCLLAQQHLHHIQQMQGAARQALLVVDLLRTAPHPPPVVDSPGTGAAPSAVEDGTDDLGIKSLPLPHRQAQGVQGAVRQPAAQAVVPVKALRLLLAACIKDVHIRAVRKIQRLCRVRQAGPPQHHPGLGPHGL